MATIEVDENHTDGRDLKKDPAYLRRVRALPCCVCGRHPPSEAHHKVGGGMGTKNPDTATMPLCTRHHREFHDLNGYFKGWVKEQLRDWQTEQVFRTLSLLGK